MAVIISRALTAKGLDLETDPEILVGFADQGKVPDWSTEALSQLINLQIIGGQQSGGKKVIKPDSKATRAESAAILKRALKKSAT